MDSVYIAKDDSTIVRPNLELKGFNKVNLKSNEEKEVEIFVSFDSLKVYSINAFKLEEGTYSILVGSSSKNLYLKEQVKIEGEKLPKTLSDDIYSEYLTTLKMSKETFEKVISYKVPEYKFDARPYTLETPIGEFNTFFGKIFRKATCGIGLKQYKKAQKIKDPLIREREKKAGIFITKLMPNNSLRSLSFSSSGLFSYPLAEGILELSNGHFFRGIKKMCKKYKIKEK